MRNVFMCSTDIENSFNVWDSVEPKSCEMMMTIIQSNSNLKFIREIYEFSSLKKENLRNLPVLCEWNWRMRFCKSTVRMHQTLKNSTSNFNWINVCCIAHLTQGSLWWWWRNNNCLYWKKRATVTIKLYTKFSFSFFFTLSLFIRSAWFKFLLELIICILFCCFVSRIILRQPLFWVNNGLYNRKVAKSLPYRMAIRTRMCIIERETRNLPTLYSRSDCAMLVN